MAVINAGELRFKVIIKAPLYNKDEGGSMEVSYPADTITTHAAVRNVSNYRNTEAGSTSQLTTKEFFIRWASNRADITKDWIIVYNGMEYIIDGIDPVDEGRNRFIKLTAKTKERG